MKFIIGSLGEYEWAGIESIITHKKVYEYTLTASSNVTMFAASIQNLSLVKAIFLSAYKNPMQERLNWIKKRISSTTNTIKSLLTQGNFNEEIYCKIKKRFPNANKTALQSIINNHWHNEDVEKWKTIDERIDVSIELPSPLKGIRQMKEFNSSTVLINRSSPIFKRDRIAGKPSQQSSSIILDFIKHSHAYSSCVPINNTDASVQMSPKRRTTFLRNTSSVVLPQLKVINAVVKEEGKVIEVCQRKIKMTKHINPERLASPNPYNY